jgi:hypothetical protein
LTYIPILGICSLSPLNTTFKLSDFIKNAQDPNGEITSFIGDVSPAWDKTSLLHRFESTTLISTTSPTVTYWEKSSKKLKWLSYNDAASKKEYVIKMDSNGLQPFTFKDSDFVISKCTPKIAVETQ